jgi:hypothetical protein
VRDLSLLCRFRFAYLSDRDITPLRMCGSFGVEPNSTHLFFDTAKGLDTCRAKLCCSSPARVHISPER